MREAYAVTKTLSIRMAIEALVAVKAAEHRDLQYLAVELVPRGLQ